MRTSASSGNLMSTQEYFASVQNPKTPRSSFDRSCEILTTLDAGYLVPLYWDEVLPADTWKISSNIFARIPTLIKPLMDNLWLDLHWIFVPNRIIHTNWVTLMGEQPDPANPVTITTPQVLIDTSLPSGIAVTSTSLGGMLGLPIGKNKLSVSAYPFRAYQKAYDDLYRDENLIAEVLPVSARGDANVTYTAVYSAMYKRAKRKDMYTSGLPWAQKGVAPTLTLGTQAPVFGKPYQTDSVNTKHSWLDGYTFTSPPVLDMKLGTASPNATTSDFNADIPTGQGQGATGHFYLPRSKSSYQNKFAAEPAFPDNVLMYADLTLSTGFTLNAFREFATIQQYLELDARGGTRYVESLQSQFGVHPEDARMQRAEYLGGTTVDLMVTPVPQTAPTSGSNAQAQLAGFGTFGGGSGTIIKSFKEDGIIMCIASIRQEQRYQQGLAKKWTRVTKYDYYRPVFANLGEQPILNEEIYCQAGDAVGNPNKGVFAYQEAWAELRYNPSIVTGKMNSDDPTSLDSWHLAQDFSSLPTLNRTFIEENIPMARVIAVPSEPAFILNGAFNLNVARAMPMRSTPGLLRL